VLKYYTVKPLNKKTPDFRDHSLLSAGCISIVIKDRLFKRTNRIFPLLVFVYVFCMYTLIALIS